MFSLKRLSIQSLLLAFVLPVLAQDAPAVSNTAKTDGPPIIDGDTTVAPTVMRRVRTEGVDDAVLYAPSTAERLRIDSSTGYVGIGTVGAAPAHLLHVYENADVSTRIHVENLHTGPAASAMLRTYSDVAGTNVASHGSGRTGLLRFGIVLAGWSEFLAWRGNGLVLGTSHPAPMILGTASYPRIQINADGKVGIGTLAPEHALDVNAQQNGLAIRAVDSTTMAQGSGAAVSFAVKTTTAGTVGDVAVIRGVKTNATSGDGSGKMLLQVTNASGTPGTIAELATGSMTFNGNAHFNGNVTGTTVRATYQDVAEWVPSQSDLTPGTVVILDEELGNGVKASTTRYDTRVAGVVSAQPGILLGEGGDSKEQIATTGRVRVKVDATQAPIAVGDLLVTSDKAGYAMKSTPVDLAGTPIHRPGTIIGKALGALPSGEGEILVLLSLQ